MIFTSIEFLIFLSGSFLIYWLLFSKNANFQNGFLLTISLIFYGCWDVRLLSLLLLTNMSCYFSGIFIAKYKPESQRGKTSREKTRWILIGTLILNLTILFLLKYYNFFLQSFIDMFSYFGKELSLSTLKILLPIGVSFYTFTALSYPIDVYKDKVESTRNFLAFVSYVSFFPALLSGPIGRATKQLPQFFNYRKFSYDFIVEGFKLILWGFFMKLCVADRLGLYVDAVYNNIAQHNGSSLRLATIMWAFQLYSDFGGYSLIAIGTGRLFGIKMQDNFIRPYFSVSFSEYWRRNHISLTEWLIDYVYYPMIGRSDKLYYWNLCMILTFLISGLWHGAAWTFILWGLYNGVFIVISTNISKSRKKFESKNKLKKNILYRGFTFFITFLIVSVGLVFFRANSVVDAFSIYSNIFSESGTLFLADWNTLVYSLLMLSILIIKDFKDEFLFELKFIDHRSIFMRWAIYIILIIIIVSFGVLDNSQFIYFQF